MACASTVAVVVPSPARSDVLLATSRAICAPMFSIGSFSSISLATLTPSFVMVGAPYGLPRITLRPRGPSVTLTASASWSMPRNTARRACSPYTICLAIYLSPAALLVCPALGHLACRGVMFVPGGVAFYDTQHFIFLHDEVLFAVEL